MPSIIPGYVYSIFAALIVGTIIVYACSISTLNVKNQANNQQLKNIDRIRGNTKPITTFTYHRKQPEHNSIS